jgi:hypothetical protein
MFDNIRFHSFKQFTIIFIALFFILLLPNVLPVHTASENQAIMENNNAKSQVATPSSIFNNNLVVAGITMIPGAGWIWLGYVMWNTGVVVASYGQPWWWSLINIFVYVELAVYAYVIMRSIKLVQLFKQRKTVFVDLDGKTITRKTTGVYPEIVKTIAVTFIVCIVVLLISALVEFFLIRGVI